MHERPLSESCAAAWTDGLNVGFGPITSPAQLNEFNAPLRSTFTYLPENDLLVIKLPKSENNLEKHFIMFGILCAT